MGCTSCNREFKESILEADSEYRKAKDAFNEKNYDKSLKSLSKAKDIYMKAGNKNLSLQKCYIKIAEICEIQKKYPEARENYLLAFKSGWPDGKKKADQVGNEEGIEEMKFFKKDITRINPEFINIDSIKNCRELCLYLLKLENEDKETFKKLLKLRQQLLVEFLKREKHELLDANYEELVELVPTEKNESSVFSNNEFTIPILKKLLSHVDDDKLSQTIFYEYIAKVLEKSVILFKKEHLFRILQILEKKLATNFQDEQDKIKILSAISKVLNSMAEIKLEGLPRIDMEEKLNEKIEIIYTECKVYNKCKFLAWYSQQALLRIPNDESGLMRTVRFCKDLWGVLAQLLRPTMKKMLPN